MSACAPPPEPRHDQQRDLDPTRDTVPNAADWSVIALDEDGGITRRPAEQSDLRHCASCTCPPEGAAP